jgi:hypothetical protein
MPHEEAEVGTKLTLDDEASEALHHVKEGFEKVHEKVLEVGKELAGMAKQAAVFAVGFQLSGMVDSLKELGEEFVHAAANEERTKAELAGMISVVEQGETSFEELTADAAEMNERFEKVARDTGNNADQMADAFEMIAARSTKSADHISDMVEQFAIASKRIPGGMQTLSGAWRDLEAGIVRPKNAIIQLMKQTGVAEGSVKKIAKGLNAALQGTDEAAKAKVFAAAEEAVDRMAKRMKDMPLTFTQILASLGGYREQFFEAAGGPIIKAFGEQFNKVRAYLEEHREEVEKLAHTIGDKVGEWVKIAAEDIQEGFQYLDTHADEIFKALEGGAKAIKDAISFIVAHRDLLIGLAAAQFVGKPALGAVAGAAGALPGLMGAAGKAIGAGAPSLGLAAGGGGVALAAAGAAGAAALGSWIAVNDQMTKLENESGLSLGRLLESWSPFSVDVFRASDALANFNALALRVAGDADNIDLTSESMEHYVESLERSGQAAVDAGAMTEMAYEQVMRAANAQAESHARLAGSMQQFQASADSVFGSGAMGVGLQMHGIADAYKAASEANAKEADAGARRILAANETLRVALAGATGSVEDALKKLKGLASGGEGTPETKLPPISFGPTTMHIHQDFRQVDPDRIAMIFRRDIARSATNRIGSRMSSAFGF